MHSTGFWPVEVKNIDGVVFLVCSRDCPWQPRGRSPLFDHRLFSMFLYTLPPWDLDKIKELVRSLDQAKVSVTWRRQYVKQPDFDRMKEAINAGEILIFATTDRDEAALKALREQIQQVLITILTQERAEAARLAAEHSNRNLMEKAGAHVAAGARGLGEASISFLTWIKNIHDVLSLHSRQRRMVRAAWETYNSAGDGDWVETFKNQLIAAEYKEVVEALGFDPLKIDREMLAKVYEIANLVWEDKETQAILVKFAEDYARAQHSLEWTNMTGGAAFEIILTVVLAAFTGGLGATALFGSKARLLTPLKKLGELFEELAKRRRKVKLGEDRKKGGAPVRASRLEDYVSDEKVPKPEPPPKGNSKREQDTVPKKLTTARRIAELDLEGHAPIRHGGPNRVTDLQLEDRAVRGIDPASGTTFDAFNKFPDGSPKPHKVGRHATAFTSDEALLQADDGARSSVQFQQNVAAARANGDMFVDAVELPLRDVFGGNYQNYVRGVTRLGSKNNPTGHIPTDFTDGTIKAIYRLDQNGNVKLHTLYPNPKL